MKKIFALISIFVLIIFSVLSKGTKYALIGCAIVSVILFTFTFIELYKYYENKKQLSSICFTLKREHLISQIINYVLFTYFLFRDVSNNVLNFSENEESFITIFILVFIVIQLYITIFHTPRLSTNGFLCSDGKFIFFNKIKSIKSEDNPMLRCKKLIVKYGNNSEKLFKVGDFDYEKVKSHLRMYGSFSIEEIK